MPGVTCLRIEIIAFVDESFPGFEWLLKKEPTQ